MTISTEPCTGGPRQYNKKKKSYKDWKGRNKAHYLGIISLRKKFLNLQNYYIINYQNQQEFGTFLDTKSIYKNQLSDINEYLNIQKDMKYLQIGELNNVVNSP